MSATVGDVLDKLQSLKTKEEARLYLVREMEQNPHFWSNVKYITGYLGEQERKRILNLLTG